MTIALCIPAYNAEKYLPRLLVSAKKQLVPFDEILVYNDCSTDNTGEIAKQYGAKVIEGDINRGCSYGKNKLAEITTCDWVHFHDADDDLLDNFTTLAHKWINKSDCPDVVLFAYKYVDFESKKLLSNRVFNDIELQEDPIKYAILNQINPFCGLYKRQKLINIGSYDIDPKILYNEDVAFHCKLAINNFTFRAESEISIVNYRLSNSMSASNQNKCTKAQFRVMEKNASQVGYRYHKEIASKLWNITAGAASQLDWDTANCSISLAKKLGHPLPDNGFLFKNLCRINPYAATRIREYLIRFFKPHLRKA